jgi:hypothetical protein
MLASVVHALTGATAEPGVLLWRTPAGRSYATTPTQYAI